MRKCECAESLLQNKIGYHINSFHLRIIEDILYCGFICMHVEFYSLGILFADQYCARFYVELLCETCDFNTLLVSSSRGGRVLPEGADSQLCSWLYNWQGWSDHRTAAEGDGCHHQVVQIQRLLPR